MCYSEYKDKLKYRVSMWKQGAQKRGLKWDLTYEDVANLLKKQKGKCFYTGIDLSFEPHSEFVISLDRIRSDEGYTKDNIRLVSWDVNNMKSTHTHTKFLKLCNIVAILRPRKIRGLSA